jgi:hypothetical protein
MKRATITIPNDLAKAVEHYLVSQEAPPTLTTLVQEALPQYLSERGFLRTRRTFAITPVRIGSGHIDGSQQHDCYRAWKQK